LKTCEIKLIESAKEVVLSLKITEQDAEKFNNEKKIYTKQLLIISKM
jgi:hypothetical protein